MHIGQAPEAAFSDPGRLDMPVPVPPIIALIALIICLTSLPIFALGKPKLLVIPSVSGIVFDGGIAIV